MSITQRLPADSVIRKFRMTATDGKAYDTPHHAESEFESYPVVQDRLYQSNFDRLLAGSGEVDLTPLVEMEKQLTKKGAK